MPHALVFGWGLSLAPHLVDGVVVGSFAAIALILWWPMTMDRLRCWQNRRTAKRQSPTQPNAHAQQATALLAE
jgi:hypothetical protein